MHVCVMTIKLTFKLSVEARNFPIQQDGLSVIFMGANLMQFVYQVCKMIKREDSSASDIHKKNLDKSIELIT